MLERAYSQTLKYKIFYPVHKAPRTESALFRRTKKHLVEVLDTPCWICGTKELREVHHFHLEWADSEGTDWDKMRSLHPNFPWSTFVTPTDFVDSEYNMVILCATHHRGASRGIHALPYPIWIMQRGMRSDFKFSED